MPAVWQEPNLSGMPRRTRASVLPLSCTCTANPLFSRCAIQSLQQPQLASFQTSTSGRAVAAHTPARGSMSTPARSWRRFMSMRVVMPILLAICFAARDVDQAFHACVVMSRIQAGKVHWPRLGELPDHLAGLTWRHRHHVRIRMLHLREFLHLFVVLFQLFLDTQDELMLDLP